MRMRKFSGVVLIILGVVVAVGYAHSQVSTNNTTSPVDLRGNSENVTPPNSAGKPLPQRNELLSNPLTLKDSLRFEIPLARDKQGHILAYQQSNYQAVEGISAFIAENVGSDYNPQLTVESLKEVIETSGRYSQEIDGGHYEHIRVVSIREDLSPVVMGALLGAVISPQREAQIPQRRDIQTAAAAGVVVGRSYLFTLTAPQMYPVEISSSPSGAEIWLGNQELDASTNISLDFSSEGIAVLWLRKAGFKDCEHTMIHILRALPPNNGFNVSCTLVPVRNR